MELICKTD